MQEAAVSSEVSGVSEVSCVPNGTLGQEQPAAIQETSVTVKQRGPNTIELLAQLCNDWIGQDMDFLLALTGLKGGGKTTLSIQLARHYWRLHFNKPMENFKLANHMAFSHADFKRLTDMLPDGSPIIVDEACNLMMSEDWNVSENKDMKKDVITLRTRHFLIIANMPDLWWFDRKYRENMITYWTHVYNRGYCALFAPSLIPGVKDRWFREYFEKLKRHWTYFTPRQQIERDLIRHPTFQDIIQFSEVTESLYDDYLLLRTTGIKKRKTDEKGSKVLLSTMRKTVKMIVEYIRGLPLDEIAMRNDIQKADMYIYFANAGFIGELRDSCVNRSAKKTADQKAKEREVRHAI